MKYVIAGAIVFIVGTGIVVYRRKHARKERISGKRPDNIFT